MSDYQNETVVRDVCVDTNPYSVWFERNVCAGGGMVIGGSGDQQIGIHECKAAWRGNKIPM